VEDREEGKGKQVNADNTAYDGHFVQVDMSQKEDRY